MAYTTNEPVKVNVQFYDIADGVTRITGKVLSDLRNLSLSLNGDIDKTSLVSMTERAGASAGEYIIEFTPPCAGQYILIYTEPTGTAGYNQRYVFNILEDTTAAHPVAPYLVGNTVNVNLKLYSYSDGVTPVTGKVLANLRNLSLALNGTTDKTSLVTMSERTGAYAGEYIISFTPDAAGHYSLIFTEPVGTAGYNQRFTFEVFTESTTALALPCIYDQVVSMLQDDASDLEADDINKSINCAILTVFSIFVPKYYTHTMSGDGTTSKVYYGSLSHYIENLTQILNVEYPVAQSPPVYLVEGTDWWTARDSTGLYIGLYSIPATGESLYIHYSGLHSADGSTLDAFDCKRVSFLATAFCLEKLACYYLQHSNSTIGGASADYQSRSDMCARRAKEYMALFYSFFGGLNKDGTIPTAPACARVEIDVKRSTGDTLTRFTHGT